MKRLFTILFVFGFVACKNEADPEADKSFFTKFYDDSNFNITYTPLDAVQTNDGGYLVLALKRLIDADGLDIRPNLVYIMKADEFGNFISENEFDINFNTPAPQLLEVDGKFYFFCMDDNSTQLIQVNETGGIEQQLNIGGTYPMAAALDGDDLLLLNYEAGSKETRISTVSTDGHIKKSKSFSIGPGGDGAEDPLMKSILRTGKQLPFQVGKTVNGIYFFNGFYNYTLSIVFTDLNADDPLTVLQGNQADGGISQLYSLNGGKFAAARFNFGDNYIMPQTALPTSGAPTSIVDYGGLNFPELIPDAPVTIINTQINATDRIIFGSNTRGKQIALFGYNPTDGTFIGSKYIGFSNSFELASLTPTTDKGLLVLGTTYIAGRFPRICLFKLSADALGDSFK